MKLKNNRKEGFTIIEVVLVLAIAGMIFLVVFLAVPQLQESRRDTQRRNDIGRVLTKLEDRAANNNGAYPSSDTQTETFESSYMDSGFTSPSGGDYDLEWSTNGSAAEIGPTSTPDVEVLAYANNVVCSGEDFDSTGANSRSIAVRGELEGGGFFCVDNQ